jgi:hypothetical protein
MSHKRAKRKARRGARKERRLTRRKERKERRGDRRASRQEARQTRRQTRRDRRTERRGRRETRREGRRDKRELRRQARPAKREARRAKTREAIESRPTGAGAIAQEGQKGLVGNIEAGIEQGKEFLGKEGVQEFLGIGGKNVLGIPGEQLQAGTLPIGPGAAAQAGKAGLGLLGKGGKGLGPKVKEGVGGLVDKAPKVKLAIQALKSKKALDKGNAAFKALGQKPKTPEDAIKLGKEIIKKEGGLLNFIKKNRWKFGFGVVFGTGGTLMGISTMATWGSADNIAGQASISMRDMIGPAIAGVTTEASLKETFDRSMDAITFAEESVDANVFVNPLLFFAGKVFKKIVEGNRASVQQSYESALAALARSQEIAEVDPEQQLIMDFWTEYQEDKNAATQQNQEFWANYLEIKKEMQEDLPTEEEEWLKNWNRGKSTLQFGLLGT